MTDIERLAGAIKDSFQSTTTSNYAEGVPCTVADALYDIAGAIRELAEAIRDKESPHDPT